MPRLHVFDFDGTLLRGASVEEISRFLGCFEQASRLERAYVRGEIADPAGWWDQTLELWTAATEDELDRAFEGLPWMEGIREVFDDISARGERSIVISQSPLFLVRRLRKWGAHATYATTVERGVPCRPEQLLRPEDKVKITTAALNELGLTLGDCVAYGDSTSDVLLFGHLPLTVAVNAAPAIRELASRAYDGPDLRGAYAVGRTLLEATHPNHRRRSRSREREMTSN